MNVLTVVASDGFTVTGSEIAYKHTHTIEFGHRCVSLMSPAKVEG